MSIISQNQHNDRNNKVNVNDQILFLLSEGFNQLEISNELKRLEIFPNSISIIDKRIKRLKELYECKTTFQLLFKYAKKESES